MTGTTLCAILILSPQKRLERQIIDYAVKSLDGPSEREERKAPDKEKSLASTCVGLNAAPTGVYI